MQDMAPTISYRTALTRGFMRRCPRCGVGGLLSGYLAPVKTCGACNSDFSHINADDGPAWVTILVLGHLIVPMMLYFGRDDSIPLWTACLVLSLVMLVGAYVTLPRAKGFFIALIWMTGATGQNMMPDALEQKEADYDTHNRL